MKIIDRVRDFIADLDLAQFYKYLGGLLVAIILMLLFMVYRYYRKIDKATLQITSINEQREQARRILGQAARVKKQRADVDALIAKEPEFKIGDFFGSVLAKLGLKDKNPINDISTIDHEGKYREIVLKAKLTDLNMKELTELLAELEQKERIYIKDLEVVAVRKDRPLIEATLTISALEPKPTGQL